MESEIKSLLTSNDLYDKKMEEEISSKLNINKFNLWDIS